MIDLRVGDCLEVMPTLEANSVDSIVTDPPYGLSFMGKDWDHGVPSVPFWEAALRVAKPGAHLLAFGGTRTFHRLACAIEDAGWEIRDTIMWVYAQGFPKSLDVSKAIDKAAGAEREVVGTKLGMPGVSKDGMNQSRESWRKAEGRIDRQPPTINITAPATPDAARWQGWGTALKPAWEPIIVARKPLRGTVAANVLAWGTGAINVDGCRVEMSKNDQKGEFGPRNIGLGENNTNGIYGGGFKRQDANESLGRWPANVIHDGSAEVLAGFPEGRSSGHYNKGANGNGPKIGAASIPIDGLTSASYNDTGSAARFFYCAKASKADRDEGCEGLAERLDRPIGDDSFANLYQDRPGREGRNPPHPARNHHPTVKPTALMRYLVRLVTPFGGTVLDLFMGSGSTGKAAVLEGFGFIGIDREPEYVEIARRRINAAQLPLLAEQ